MAFIEGKGDRKSKLLRVEENHIAGMLNVVVVLAIAAVAYTDWVVVANISLGYLYVLPIALSALINPLPFTIALSVFCAFLQDLFGPAADPLPLRVFHGDWSCGISCGGISCHADRETA